MESQSHPKGNNRVNSNAHWYYTNVQGFRQFETSYTAAIAFLVIVMLSVAVIFALRRMEIAR